MTTATTTTPQVAAPVSQDRQGSRVRFKTFLAGLPALVLASAMATSLNLGATRPLVETYERESVRRLKRDDFAGALVCYKRLLAWQPDRVDVRFATVLMLERLGRLDEAEAVARVIAPATRGGYPPAHLWLAQRLVANAGRSSASSSTSIEAEGHLLRFLQANPDSIEARVMLGTLYAATGRPRRARPYIEATAGTRPDRLMLLAGICRSLGEQAEAITYAREALEAARRQAETRPDDKALRIAWADACAFLEDYPGALEVLKDGDRLTRDPLFRRRAAGVAAAWADALARDKARFADRLSVLQLGLSYDATNPALLSQFGSLLASGDPAQAEQARAALRAALAAGQAPALAHFLLGGDAWSRGQRDEARSHWEQAYRLDPKTPYVANNLAWVLAHQKSPDLPKALALIDQALAQTPGDAALRGTRGEILARMERWKEAVADIEAALAGGASTPNLHAALASSYEHLGMHEMASEHRKPTP